MLKLRRSILLLIMFTSALVTSMPGPDGSGHEHTHFIIHVPHFIHKHHHTHVKKIYIPVESHDDDHHHHEYEEDGW